jgi:hypothetical protein
MAMETETIDKLFLELSQVTTATTLRERTLAWLVRRLLSELPLPRNRSQSQAKLVTEAEAYLRAHGLLENAA